MVNSYSLLNYGKYYKDISNEQKNFLSKLGFKWSDISSFNIKAEDIEIKKGECIGQAIFQKFEVVDNDNAEGERTGGFGSTSK